MVAILLLSLSPLQAQTARPNDPSRIELPNPLTPEAMNALVARLSDAEVRQLLLDQLGAVAAKPKLPAPVPTTSVAMRIKQINAATRARVVDAIEFLPTAVGHQMRVIGEFVFARRFFDLIGFLASLALIAGAGAVANRLASDWIGNRGRGRQAAVDQPMKQTEVTRSAFSTVLSKLAATLITFFAMILAVGALLAGSQAAFALIIAFWLVLVPRLLNVFLTAALEPWQPERRPVFLDDAQAKGLHRSLRAIFWFFSAALALKEFNLDVALPQGIGGETVLTDVRRLAVAVNLVFLIWLGMIVVRFRASFAAIIRGNTETLGSFERGLAAAYPWVALVAIALTWAVSAIAAATSTLIQMHSSLYLVSLLILLVAPLLDVGIRTAVRKLARPMQGQGAVAEQAYAASLHSYQRMARVVIYGTLVAISIRLWGVSLSGFASVGLGAKLATLLSRELMICAVGYLVWEILRLAINRKLAKERTETRVLIDQDDVEGQGNAPVGSRLATVLPPISWTLQAVIIAMTVLTALGNIGIDVTPLLAGAGVVGIAVGFGAQKLVADIVSGLFFLLDDAFRLNEYIDAGGTFGTVERISLRSLRLRDDNGPLYCIPYSEISRVTNFGRDWGIMKLKFTVPFDTDPDKVRRIFKKIGQDMLKNPELADSFIEPFKSQGVNAFTDTGIVVRGKFKFKPGTQFAIRKEIYSQVQKEFAANGIEFARKEVRVKISGGESLTPEQLNAIAAGAAETALAP